MCGLRFGATSYLLLILKIVAADDIEIVYQRMHEDAYAGASHQSYEEILGLLNSDGSFSDLKYGTDGSNSFMIHGKRQSALLYHHLQGEADLKDEVLKCFQYITYDAPPNTDTNWWGHLIGTPLDMWKGLVLGNSVLDQQIIIDFLDRYWVNTQEGPVWPKEGQYQEGNFAGGNFGPRALLGEVEGIIRGTYNQIHDEVSMYIHKEIAQRNPYKGNGIRPDGCLHQHNPQGNHTTEGHFYLANTLSNPYAAEYGKELIRHVSMIMAWYSETDLDYDDESIEGLYSTYFQCQQWIFRGNVIEPTVAGRKIPNGLVITRFGASGLIHETGLHLQKIGRHPEEVASVLHRFDNVVPEPEYALIGHRHFFYTDLSVHQRREYYASVRILSNRTVRPESWSSGENIEGFFQADGFMTVLVDGGEYGKKYNEVFQVYDWARLPSVTNQYTTDIPGFHLNSYNSRRFFNDVKFSGGVTDGYIGVASMVYNRPYVPLKALKSWFFFDDVIMVVGSGITLETEHINQKFVATTLTQIVFAGNYVVCTGEGEEISLNIGTYDYFKPSWLFHRNVSYIFMNGDEHIHSVAEKRTHDGHDLDVFMAWTTHTASPVDKKLAYAVLPSVSVETTRQFINNPTIELLNQDSNSHVVCHHPSIAVGASLFTEGKITVTSCGGKGPLSIEANIPCLIMATIEESENNQVFIALSLADPQQIYDEAEVLISYEGRATGKIQIDLPREPLRGSSITTHILV